MVPAGGDMMLNLVTGFWGPWSSNSGADFNLYAGGTGGALFFYVFADEVTGQSSVADAPGSSQVANLPAGTVVGPSSPLTGSGQNNSLNWVNGASGYVGLYFRNEVTGQFNYGYVELQTTGPNGFPATITRYVYNSAGNAITIPGGGGGGDPEIGLSATNFNFSVPADTSSSQNLVVSNTGAAGSTLNWTIAEAAAATSVAPKRAGTIVLGQTVHADSNASFGRSGLAAGQTGLPISPRGAGLTLSQNTSTVPMSAHSIACGASGTTADNVFLRRFYFDEHPGLEGGADITSVDVSVEVVNLADVQATVQLYTVPSSTPVDTIPALSSLTQIGTHTVTIPVGTALTSVNVPVTGTVSDTTANDLVVAVSLPSSSGVAGFYPGSNNAGQTHPGFLASVACSLPNPTTFAAVGFPDVHLILTANAEPAGGGGPTGCDAPQDIPWLTVSNTGGALASGASATSAIGVNAAGMAVGTYEAQLCVDSDDPVTPRVAVPVALEVTAGGGSNGIYYSAELNYPIPATLDGTSLNFVTETFDDNGPISGPWDINFYATGGQLRAFYISTYQARFVVDGAAIAVLQPGDTVGPSSVFSTGTGIINPGAAWLAGADAYMGVRFSCDGRLTHPVPGGFCYGYIHVTTTGTTGFPATIVNYAFDGDGNPITIPTGGGGSGDLVVDPAAVVMDVPVGTADSEVVTLSNEGSTAIDWNMIPEMVSVVSEDFEGTFPPAGWTLTDTGTPACPWFQTNGTSMSGFVPGSTGQGAAIDADACGSGGTYNASLVSAPIDLTGYGQATLNFDLSYRHLSTLNLSVDVSTDGGATWTSIQSYSGSVGYPGAPVEQEIDLSAYANQTIQIRWNWQSGWTWWAWIDNVEVVARDSAAWPLTCWDPSVDWLTVAPTSGTIAASADQAVTVSVDDTLAPGTYNTELCIAADDGSPIPMVVVPVEVTVTAPSITVDPTEISATVDPGDSATETLTIGNTGDGELVYTIDEAPAGLVNPRAHFPAVDRSVAAPFDPSASAAAEQIPAEVLAKLEASVSRGQESRAAGLRGATGVPAYTNTGFSRSDYVSLDATVPGALTSIVDPAVGTIYAATFLDNDFSRQFFIAGTPATGAILPVGAYGFVDTATGTHTQLGVVSTPAGASWTSAAQDPTTGTVYAVSGAGAGTNILWTVNPSTGATTQVGPISGAQLIVAIAISPEGLMYGLDIGTDNLIAIDKTNGAQAVIGPVGQNANFAQDMDFDQSTGILYWAGYMGSGNSRMYTVDTSTGAATEIGQIQDGAELLSFSIAVAGGNCSDPADVPWLTLSSTGGTIAAGGADQDVTVTMNSAGLPEGLHEASICVRSNDPNRAVVEVPVSFIVGEIVDDNADLALTLFSVPGTVDAGGSASIVATVANFGPADAADVEVELELPAEFSFVSGRLIEGSGNWVCAAAGQTVACELTAGTLPTGSFAAVLQVDVSVAVDAGDGVAVTNGTVSSSNPDPNAGNNTASTSTTIIGGPGDCIFADGFEGGTGGCGPAVDPDIVDSGPVNLVINTGDDMQLNMVTGEFGPYSSNSGADINWYPGTAGVMFFYVFADEVADQSSVADAPGSSQVAVLQSGATIGPDSPLTTSGQQNTANWIGGTSGYIGLKFWNESTNAWNYGYVQFQTTGPNGFPGTATRFVYNKAGNAITIP
ncbi:hypothetical protein B1808_08485 [Pseudofulvimonas gallinarii]|nr:hypothetical protein B1808_08485 [Pseudofulvimonas gallinarii]